MARPDFLAYIAANDKAFHDAMARVRADGKMTATTTSGYFAQFASRGVGFGKAFVAGLAGGIAAGGLAGIIGQIGDVARSVAEIGDEAKRTGVSAQAFQEWKFVAEQNRIGIDQMTDGLKELNLRADEFVQTGSGSAAEAFQRLGYGAQDLKAKLKDPSALLLEIIDRLGKFDKAAQIRISDELFGGSAGERFVELIGQGADGIRATIQEAHNLNAVLDDEVIASAAELDKRFNAVATTVGTALKSAIVSAAESLTDFINAFRGFQFERAAKLDERMAALGKDRLDVERQIIDLKDKQRRGESVGDGIFGSSLGESTYGEAMADYQRRLEAIAAEEKMIGKIIDERNAAKPPASTWTPPPTPPGGFGGATASRKSATAATDRQAEAVKRLIAELEEELSLVGASDQAKRAAEAARKAGAAATDEERQRVVALTEAIYQQQHALDEAKKADEARKQSLSSLFDMAGDALGSIADGSVKAEDAIKKLAIQLGIAAAQAALLGTGPLAGLFGSGGIGSLFDGGGGSSAIPWAEDIFRASGGPVKAGQPYIVGEKRPELFVPDVSGSILPSVPSSLATGGSASAAGPTIVYSPTYNFSGTSEEMAKFREQARRDREEFSARVIQTVRKAQKSRAL
jgi:hypothetical protein